MSLPVPGTQSRKRPKSMAVKLTLVSGERTGMVSLWDSGAASLLFIDTGTSTGTGTGHTWQDQPVLTSEHDLPRVLAPLVQLVEAAAEGR
ncbi:hypothetical protein [Streptomyces sp. NPDC002666]